VTELNSLVKETGNQAEVVEVIALHMLQYATFS
jgi:hypothetical protein